MPTSPSAPSPETTPVISKLNDLEIKDAHLIFESAWRDIEGLVGKERLRFPKEIILLGGAPGSGKGTNTGFITKTRGSVSYTHLTLPTKLL
jgi:adenylate kinase